ncbi:MAG: FecR family protein [Lachnospiraceae bacterium]|nr:FecR family protein [Lachnospiraceae bacterium]
MDKRGAAIIAALVLLLVVLVVALRSCGTDGEEEQVTSVSGRVIYVVSFEGSVGVERDGQALEVYENMSLTAGDTISAGADSTIRLSVDDTIYVQTDPDTTLVLEVSGTKLASQTSIDLVVGGFSCYVKEALNEESSFGITTPNATMAVRGTVFYIYWNYRVSDIVATHVLMMESVADCINLHTSEEITVTDGDHAIITLYPDGEEGEDTEVVEMAPEDLSLEALQFFHEVSQERELYYTTEELLTYIEERENAENLETEEPEEEEDLNEGSSSGSGSTGNTQGNTVEVVRNTDDTVEEDTTEEDTETTTEETEDSTGSGSSDTGNSSTDTGNGSADTSSSSSDTSSSSDNSSNSSDSSGSSSDDSNSSDNSGSSSDDSNSSDNSGSSADDSSNNTGSDDADDNTGSGTGNTDDNTGSGSDDNSNTESGSDDSSGSGSDDNSNTGSGSDDTDDNTGSSSDDGGLDDGSSDDNTTITTYTVTFVYGVRTVGTQTVDAGSCASAPLLQPSQNGYWSDSSTGTTSYDFTSGITADTTIYWVAQ